MKELTIDIGEIKQIGELHDILKETFGFPHFYGKNVHALIDCLSSLRYPEDEMTKITLDIDESLYFKLENTSKSSKEVIIELLTAISNVNRRQINIGNTPSILFIPM